jgi:hypothetical protein
MEQVAPFPPQVCRFCGNNNSAELEITSGCDGKYFNHSKMKTQEEKEMATGLGTFYACRGLKCRSEFSFARAISADKIVSGEMSS